MESQFLELSSFQTISQKLEAKVISLSSAKQHNFTPKLLNYICKDLILICFTQGGEAEAIFCSTL